MRLLAFALFLLLSAGSAAAQTITAAGDPTLTLAYDPATQTFSGTDETSQLAYTSAAGINNYRITVEGLVTSGPQRYTLSVEAFDEGSGTVTGPVGLVDGGQPLPLIVDIPPAAVALGPPQTASLRYTSTATLADGAGTDSWTVTYTISEQ